MQLATESMFAVRQWVPIHTLPQRLVAMLVVRVYSGAARPRTEEGGSPPPTGWNHPASRSRDLKQLGAPRSGLVDTTEQTIGAELIATEATPVLTTEI